MKLISELNKHNFKTNPSIDKNLKTLFDRLIELQDAYGSDLTITSGLRSDEQQADLIKNGLSNAVHSKHCVGAAADVYDPNGNLAQWCKGNICFIEQTGFWLEDFSHTPTWVHFQIMAPKSGKRIFIP
jgi:LAS superfamily LD-carboxypeptidase LdcB